MRSFKYRKVVKELQEGLRTPLKKANATIRGSTFNIDFIEQAIKDYFNTTKGSQKGKILAYNRRLKRAGTLVNEEIFCKKLTPKYLACRIRGHSIWDY